MTTKEKTEALDLTELIADCQKAGITVQPYQRAPSGMADVLVITLTDSRDKIYISPGKATSVSWAVDKKFSQAVVTVTEDARKVSETLKVNRRGMDPTDTLPEEFLSCVRGYTKMAFSRPTRITVDSTTTAQYELGLSLGGPARTVIDTMKVTHHVPKSVAHFLLGKDESGLFVSMLREEARSVQHAHQILRPKGLKSTTVRVGEWFFDPVTDKALTAQLNELYVSRTIRSVQQGSTNSGHKAIGKDVFTNHRAQFLATLDRTQYVMGLIIDTRRKHPHKPILLNGWHKVVRNRERPQPQSARNWD